MIQFEHVTKSFENRPILKELNFTIESGELVTLIGESGCGKTTTLKMINRLLEPTTGRILINGRDIMEENVIRLRRSMGYVIQSTGLFPHMTIRQNIELIERLEKRDGAQIAARTLELMKMVNMDPAYLDCYPTELSGGQKQRIGVARAFATDPEIILMDEPFSALDPLTRSQLQDELVTLQEDFKKTIVFVTHDMGEAIKIADKICMMYQGGDLTVRPAGGNLKTSVQRLREQLCRKTPHLGIAQFYQGAGYYDYRTGQLPAKPPVGARCGKDAFQ